jgi:hypothetical protein
VQTDLLTALSWNAHRRTDISAHVKSMLNGVSPHVPVGDGQMALGTWQAIHVTGQRERPHRREVVFSFSAAAKRFERPPAVDRATRSALTSTERLCFDTRVCLAQSGFSR